jgi:aromatic-L-amino-acid decarboxylase
VNNPFRRRSPLDLSAPAKFASWLLLLGWSFVVLFPIYWLVVTSFKNSQDVDRGPFYIPFVDFKPNLDAWNYILVELGNDTIRPYVNTIIVGLSSSLIALAAAREAAGVDAAAKGVGGREGVPRLRVYASEHAHSSIDKACMTLGLGRESLVHIASDPEFRLLPEELAAAIAADRAAGHLPIAIVATAGTTSTTSVDPIAAVADIAASEGLWLHVDAAYAGAVAIVPELRGPFAGWERADSIVVNPHKWLFTPLDASLLLSRRLDAARDAFSLMPEYLRTLDRASPVRDYHEFTPQLGRRFRALKLWMQLRWFGLEGLRRRIRRHIELATWFATEIDAAPEWERLAPVPFSTVCFRHRPAGITDEADLERHNQAVIDAVNRTGEVFLSHTKLGDRFAIRLSVGNLRTEARHVARALVLLQRAAEVET